MLPNRYVSGHSLATRKSRLDGKPSLIPRRPGSSDRTSTEARRPSNTGARSSSADTARGTFGSSTRPRSQTGEFRYGVVASTPLHSSHYSKSTTTPIRTPDDRNTRSWEACLERALAFVTVKDQRTLSNIAWQRAEVTRVSEALSERGGGAALIRPLTIARFVEIVGDLLSSIMCNTKLTNDNYVAKLPHLSKRLLYPSPVSKSWLQTVNTLHAFPHALGLVGYLLDIATHCQMPVSDEMLYIKKDELSCLKRDYLNKCWIRFQVAKSQFDDLKDEYLQSLKSILCIDEEKIQELQQDIDKLERQLENEEEIAAREDEARRTERRDALATSLRSERAALRATRAELDEQRAARHVHEDELQLLDAEIERASVEIERLRAELEIQPLTVEERTRLLDEVDYATRVYDSKRALAEQLSKMLLSKENELAQWQKKTLDTCVEYKQGLINLSTQLPALVSLAIDEKELMGAECAAYVAKAVQLLREQGSSLSLQKAELARTRSALGRKRAILLEETQTKITELRETIQREQQALEEESLKEMSEAAAWNKEQLEIAERLKELKAKQEEYAKIDAELEFWEKQDLAWRTKLSELREYIESQRSLAQRRLAAVRETRARQLRDTLQIWNDKLGGR